MQLKRLFSRKRSPERQIAGQLYAAILAGALHPDLYEGGVAVDTFDGRFEQVALHGALVMRHLRAYGAQGRAIAEALNDAIFSGFDHAYRETGVGDSSISRKVRALGERFFGLARGLDAALDAPEGAVFEDFIARNGLGGDHSAGLISYLRRANKSLSQQVKAQDRLETVRWPVVMDGAI